MQSFLAYFNVTLVAVAATFVATLVFSQKIKDFFSGVPADLRTALNTVEGKAKVDLKTAAADVVAKIAPAAKPAVVAAPAPAPVDVSGAGAAPKA